MASRSHPYDMPMQVVSLHCALTDETKHLINTERLNMMKKDAVLVNASRGPVVDEVALVKHLQENPNFRSALHCQSFPFSCKTDKCTSRRCLWNRKLRGWGASQQAPQAAATSIATPAKYGIVVLPLCTNACFQSQRNLQCFRRSVGCRAGLDVFEDEPKMKPGLADCENAVIVPHIASASLWTRAGMVCHA